MMPHVLIAIAAGGVPSLACWIVGKAYDRAFRKSLTRLNPQIVRRA